jgi:hypothetical protein
VSLAISQQNHAVAEAKRDVSGNIKHFDVWQVEVPHPITSSLLGFQKVITVLTLFSSLSLSQSESEDETAMNS